MEAPTGDLPMAAPEPQTRLCPRGLWRGHRRAAACGSAYVLLPAIPTTGLLSVMDPVEPQKKASP